MGRALDVSVDQSRPMTSIFLCVVLISSLLVATDGLSIRLIRRDKVDTNLFPKNLSDVEKHRIYANLSLSRALHWASLANPSLNRSVVTPGIDTISPKLRQEVGSMFAIPIAIGSKPHRTHLLFDSGSHLTWVQCEECKDCFLVKGGAFDTRLSSSFRRLKSTDRLCRQRMEDRGVCAFDAKYAGGKRIKGIIAVENVKFTTKGGSTETTVQRFLLGCATSAPVDCFYPNVGPENPIAGIFGMGLGYHQTSFMELHESITKMKFSYCLPPWDKPKLETDVLFGDDVPQIPRSAKTTRLVTTAPLYKVTLTGISVAGERLQLSSGDLGGAQNSFILDTGSVASVLRVAAADRIKEAFRRRVPRNSGLEERDVRFSRLCYKPPSNWPVPGLPSLTYHLGDGADLVVEFENVFKRIKLRDREEELLCMMILAKGPEGVALLGAVNMANYEFVHNLRDKTLSFYRKECGRN